MSLGYSVTIGSARFASAEVDRGQAQPLIAIESEVGIGGTGGWCHLDLGDPSWSQPAVGEAVEVELDAGDGATKVFTGEVELVERRATALLVRARDELAKLAHVEVEAAYEEVSAGFIVSDLCDQASAATGEIEDGPTFPSYLVHRGPRALRHAQRLAQLIGAELGSDGEGQVHFRRPGPPSPAHRLVWGEDLLAVELCTAAPSRDAYLVWGEGAAGSQGPERAHWLPTDLSGVSGEAQVSPGATPEAPGTVSPGAGTLPRTVIDGSIRSAEVAGELAQARAQLVALRPLTGHLRCLGRPDIQVGEWVELADLPSAGPSTPLQLRVLRVIHDFALGRGLLTRLEF